ncbi:MAG: thioredoxin family protein [Armatimonadota bacterium]|nr:thioredoxin family protein [Armatimonadota bacterium]
MRILKPRDAEFIQKKLSQELVHEVRLVFFTQGESGLTVPGYECAFCAETRALLEDLGELSDKLRLEVYDFLLHEDQVRTYNIDKIPAIVLVGDKDTGVRFYGIPSGYEFATLLEDIIDVSRRSTRLSQSTIEKVATIDRDVHIQVFVTPTCPYCPRAVRLAHQMAMVNDKIRADMVEATEFPHLAMRYNVYGVPKVVINETVMFEGAVPEQVFLEYVLQAVASS